MSELNELRNEIDVIDRQMMELFRRRMDVTRQVGEYKLAHGLPVLDQARERQVLAEKAALAGPELAPAAVRLYQTVMALSRRQQRDLTGERATTPACAGSGRPWVPCASRWRTPGWCIRACPGRTASRPAWTGSAPA